MMSMLLLGGLLTKNNPSRYYPALRQLMKSFSETKIRILQNSLQGDTAGVNIAVEFDRILEELRELNYNNGKYVDSKLLGYGTNFTQFNFEREDSTTYSSTRFVVIVQQILMLKTNYIMFL